ncbi:hypothetical protein [Corynebacterium sp. H113]|uniref:hypothetical protein n=1 Tax=Corynebacterium sp. H113 TaxID=3133419 RepID=UPI00309AD2BD
MTVEDKNTNVYDSMLLARKFRLVLLVAFCIFMAYQKLWILLAIGVALIVLTLWQNKRLKEEIAVRQAEMVAEASAAKTRNKK